MKIKDGGLEMVLLLQHIQEVIISRLNILISNLERGPWSDSKGRIDCPKQSFKLPTNEWSWIEDWQVKKGLDTDSDGWGYAYDFLKPFHPIKGKLDFVKRRMWTRTCILTVPAVPISNLVKK